MKKLKQLWRKFREWEPEPSWWKSEIEDDCQGNNNHHRKYHCPDCRKYLKEGTPKPQHI